MHCAKTCDDNQFLQRNFPIRPIDTQYTSQKTTSHYLNALVKSQNIRYRLEVSFTLEQCSVKH